MENTPAASLMVLVFTDIAGSVDLKTRFGNRIYQRLVSRHDQLFSDTVQSFAGGEILKDTGDGFFARFATASDAVAASLRFQAALANEQWDPEPVRVRIGIHIGEVAEMQADVVGKPKLVGLATDMAARIMGLALPGQILMTRTAFDDSRQYLRGQTGAGDEPPAPLRWMAHGSYLFKGSDDPLEIFEVGVEGISPLKPPPDSEKARRAVAADEEATLGWRPARGLEVPGRKGWALEKKLGEGGFGEVWLATHRKTRERRVFKFCFDPDRVKSFKRELTIFRLIREALGERKDIARLYEIQLEKPPFYLESEYTASGDLLEWAKNQGGIQNVPLKTRLDLVAATAEATAAAHSIGILHKDIKPGNILMFEADDGSPRPRLSDFGIGSVADRSELLARNITVAGFTETELLTPGSTHTGTRLYSPPESLIGKRFSIQGDIYALGVLLYQIVIGDFGRPLGTGWERDVMDDVLRDDISRCVDRDPERRLPSAAELAQRIRTLQERRVLRLKAKRRKAIVRAGSAFSAAVAIVAVALTIHTGRIARERDRANQEAETLRAVSEFIIDLFEVSDPGEARGSTVTAREILDRGAQKITQEMAEQPRVRARFMTTMGRVYMKLGLYEEARPLLEEASSISRGALGDRHADVAKSLSHLAILLTETGQYEEARLKFEKSLEIAERAHGPEHPQVAYISSQFGRLLAQAGHYEDARPLFDRALTVNERTLGSDHINVAISLNNLALLLWRTGDNEGARPLFERALKIREKRLGPDHPDVAADLSNLAILLWETGVYEEAQPLLERALAIDEKTLGPDHPHVAMSLNNLATLLIDKGNYRDARPMLERALATYEKTLGPDHPDLAMSLNNLADLLRRSGDYANARLLFERAVEIDERALGPTHPDVATDLHGLATLLDDMGELDASRPIFERALAIREDALDPYHPDVAESLRGLAGLLRKQGNYEAAGPHLERALEIQERSLDPNHPELARTLTDYASLLRRTGRPVEAEELESRARAIEDAQARNRATE